MKKILAIMLALAMVLGLAACGSPKETTAAPTEAPKTTEAPNTTEAPTEAPTTEPAPTEPEVKILSYTEFMAAAQMEPVVIEAYVQGKQEYYAAKQTANLYLADKDGAYYAYGCTMTQEQFDKLEAGVKVRISGEKAEYAGEIEIGSGVVEAIDENDKFEAAFVEAAGMIGDNEALEKIMNQKVNFAGLVVMPQSNGEAISRKESDSDPDLYFRAGNEQGYVDFCVESYLTGKDSDTYKAVEALKLGDIVKVEGFLYWYNGANPHVLGVEVTGSVNDKSKGVMTYEEFMATEKMEPVVIEAYVQGKQSYYAAKETANVYLADADGGYYCYGLSLTQEQFDKLEVGTKVRVSGEMGEYAGELEVANGVLEEILEGNYTAQPIDLTAAIGLNETLEPHMNQKFAGKGLVVMAQNDGSAVGKKESDSDPDLYIRLAGENGVTDFCVESFLTDPDSETYKIAAALKVGDVVDVEAFLYWYNGANPHVTAIAVTGNVNDKSEGVMSYEQYAATEKMEAVVIEAYVQGKQDYYAAKETANIYLADADGAYYCYGLSLTQEQFDKLEAGTKVRVSGEMGEYAGEIEVANGKLEEILEGKYIAAPVDVTGVAADELVKYMNRKVIFRNLVVRPQEDGTAVSKKDSDSDPDLYFAAANEAETISFCVESYLTGPDTDVYKTVESLEVDDTVNITGFLYWYNGANPHVLSVEAAE